MPTPMPNRRSAHIALIVLEQEEDTDVVSKCMHLLLQVSINGDERFLLTFSKKP